MNETRLHGWRPRRPSPGLKRRIFSAAEQPAPAWHWHRLAPAMACLMFAMLMIHFNVGGPLRESKPVMALVLSNDNRAAGFSDSAQESENHLATVTFDWTNHTGFKSSMGFTPTTNSSY
ncbi:MAG TPA: hypothetical protein VIK53_02370 [Verrucomicrobiae bacterium]